MAVAPAVVRAIVEAELECVRPWVETHGWDPGWEPETLRLRVSMTSQVDHERYDIEFALDDYRELPPFIEFVKPSTGERGTPACYPKGGRGYFHGQPVVCAPWNQKAYAVHGGPHQDWAMRQWTTYRPNHSTLPDILVLLQDLLNDKDTYAGRMG